MAKRSRSLIHNLLVATVSISTVLGTVPLNAVAEELGSEFDNDSAQQTIEVVTDGSSEPELMDVYAADGSEALVSDLELDEEVGSYADDQELVVVDDEIINTSSESLADVTAADDESLASQANSGTLDGCTWTLSDDGTLTITAGQAEGSYEAGELSSLSRWASMTSSGSKVRRVAYAGGVRPHLGVYSAMPSYGFPNVTTIDVTGLDTTGITSFNMMFHGLAKLTEIVGLDKLDTSSVASMDNMFSYCTALESIDLTNVDTSNVSNMSNMFWRCSRLKTVKGFENLDIQNVDRIEGIFSGCSSITSITMPKGAQYVTQFGSLFSGCKSLRSVDMSGLDMTIASAQEYSYNSLMFYDCDALSCIILGKQSYLLGSNLPDGTWYSGTMQLTAKELEDSPIGSVAGTWKRNPFSDVPMKHWAREVIWKAINLGLMSGYTRKSSVDPALFGTNDNITRGQIAVILWNWAGKPEAGAKAKSFTDVKNNAYYYSAVRWAGSVGVVSGYANGSFGPNDNITRQQLAVMLANYAQKVAGVTVTGSLQDFAAMSDASQVSSYARTAMGWCVRNGILSGSDGALMPKGHATRAQAAKMVVFLYDLIS